MPFGFGETGPPEWSSSTGCGVSWRADVKVSIKRPAVEGAKKDG